MKRHFNNIDSGHQAELQQRSSTTFLGLSTDQFSFISELLKFLSFRMGDHSMHAAMDHSATHENHGVVHEDLGVVHDADHGALAGGAMKHDGKNIRHINTQMKVVISDMMKMYFHGGYNEVILFSFWRISTVGGLIGSMIGCFLLGVLYEGLKFFREFILRKEYR